MTIKLKFKDGLVAYAIFHKVFGTFKDYSAISMFLGQSGVCIFN